MIMTAEEAKQNQDRIAEHYDLSHWYGTNCRKCCGVYPKFIAHISAKDLCHYECEVCGRRTADYEMPWQAQHAWNNGEIIISQAALF